jgi:hypothetical protein
LPLNHLVGGSLSMGSVLLEGGGRLNTPTGIWI